MSGWVRVADGLLRRGSTLVIDFRSGGRRVYRRLGPVPIGEAKKILAELRVDLARRVAGVAPAPAPATVSAIIEAYLDDRSLRSAPKTIRLYRFHARRLAPRLGGLDARMLTLADVRAYHRSRIDDGASPATVNRETTLLSAALRATVREGRIERNPIAGVEKLPEREAGSVAREITEADIERITGASEAWFGRFVRIASETGCRAGELCAVRLDDIETDGGRTWITFRAEEVKGRRGRRRTRRIPLSPRAVEAVAEQAAEARRRDSPHLFPAPSDPAAHTDSHRATVAWVRACRRTGVRGRLHDLRHSFVTRKLLEGHSPSVVAKFVGHSSTQMIDRVYGHLWRGHREDLLGLVGGGTAGSRSRTIPARGGADEPATEASIAR